MAPEGRQFGEGLEHEGTLGHAWVGHLELGRVDNQIIDGYDVYVDDAVGIRAVGVAVGLGRYGALDGLQLMQNLQRREVGENHHANVEKLVLRVEPPGL